jgi:hypothetical protein
MHKKLIESRPIGEQKGIYGVEIECEGDNLPAAVFGWDVHKEGSLRGEAKEYVTACAVTMPELDKLMDMLTHALKNNDAVVNDECFRASTHIHVNCQRLTYAEIFSAIIAFQMIEPVFMRLCGPTRDGNLFCLPSYDCGDMPNWIEQSLPYLHRTGNLWRGLERGKYASLNTNNLMKIGTLEFRTFPCSIDKSQIKSWASWCSNIVLEGRAQYGIDKRKMVQSFFDDPSILLNGVFGREAMRQFTDHDLASMVELGAETAFDSAVAYESYFNAQAKKAA